MKYIILYFLLFNQIQSQYVMEWASPMGLELKEFADSDSPIQTSNFFDVNGDYIIDIVSQDENDNFLALLRPNEVSIDNIKKYLKEVI